MFTRKLTRSEYASLPPDEQTRYRDWVHNGAVPETSENAKGTESEAVPKANEGMSWNTKVKPTKAEEPVENVSVDNVSDGSTDEPNDRVSDDSTDETNDTADETNDSTDETNDRVSDNSTEESFDNVSDEPIEEPVDDSTEESFDEIVDDSTDEPSDGVDNPFDNVSDNFSFDTEVGISYDDLDSEENDTEDDSTNETSNEVGNSFDDVSDDFSFDVDFDTDNVSDDSNGDSTDGVSDDFSFDDDLNFDDEEPIFNDSDSNGTDIDSKETSADAEHNDVDFNSEGDINYDDLDSKGIELDNSSIGSESGIDEPDESGINYDDVGLKEDELGTDEPDESGISYDDLNSDEESVSDDNTDEEESADFEDNTLFADEDDTDSEDGMFTDDTDSEDGMFADDTDSEDDEDLFAEETFSETEGNLFADDIKESETASDVSFVDDDVEDLFANEEQTEPAKEQPESIHTDEVIDESDWSFNDEEDDLFGTDTIICQADEEPISEKGLALASAISEFTGTDMYTPDEQGSDTSAEQDSTSDETQNEHGIKPDKTSAEQSNVPSDTPAEPNGTQNEQGTTNEQGINSDETPTEPTNERLDELAQAISDFGLDDTESPQKPTEVEQKSVKTEQKPKKHFGKKSNEPKKPKETKPSDKKPKEVKEPSDKNHKTHKKGLLIVGIVLIIALAGFIAFKFFTKGSSYMDDLNAIFDAETGTFNYKFTVTSSAVGDTSNSNSKTADALGKEAKATSKGTKDKGKTENTWTSDSDLATNYWDSPNYIVEIKGQKKSADKYSATIYLTTKDKSAEFTDILVDKDTTYINAGKLMSYLNSTSDAYLHNLGKDLNLNTSAYIKCKSSDLAFNVFGLSNDASATGITQKADRIALVRKMLTSTLSKYFKTDKKSNTDGTVLNLSAKDTDGVLDSIRSLVQNSGNVYDSYISNAETLYSKDGYKVAKANKPVFVESMDSMADYMSTHSNKDINLRVSGESDKYTSIDGADTQTVTLTSNYVLDGYNYTVTGEFTHKAGNVKIDDVKSSADFSDTGVLANFYTDFIMYLNPTNYNFKPSVESKDVFIDSLIKFVDEESKGKIRLNKVNALWFIKRYSNIEDANSLSTKDKECYDIYTKFKDTVHDTLVQGNDSEGTTNKYSQVSAALPNNLTAQYTVNTNETTSGMLVVDVIYTNTTGKDVVVDNSKYKLASDSGSTVIANDSTLIQGYDANFDMNLVANTVTVSDTLQTKLYFVRHIDEGAASITFEDANLGALVNA